MRNCHQKDRNQGLLFDDACTLPPLPKRADARPTHGDPNDPNVWMPDPLMRPARQLETETVEALGRSADSASHSCDGNRHNRPSRERESVQLRWDFRTTFPEPLESALENGRLDPSDLEPENLAALHAEHARELLATLAAIDRVRESKRLGRDPNTGRVPRTVQQRERLAKVHSNEPARLQHAFEVLLDVYGECFGDEAAAELKVAVTCLHAGVEVTSQSPAPRTAQYDPSHPWHYYHKGDGASPMPAGEIPAAKSYLDLGVKLPRDRAKRREKLQKLYHDASDQLARDIERYTDLAERGVEALSNYDRTIAYGGNDAIAIASSLALKYNHISLGKSRLAALERTLGSRLVE